MFKKSISFPLIYFMTNTIWQLSVKNKVIWLENLIVCFIMFLLFLLYEWSKTPYKWNKENSE
jgi:Trk-type K+ transport system membrane component